MNRKPIKPGLIFILLLLSCGTLFGDIVPDTIMKLTYLSPENNSSIYYSPMAAYVDNQWNNTQTNVIGSLDKFRIDKPLAQNPNLEQVTVIAFIGWPVTIDSIVKGADTLNVFGDSIQPIKVYYHLTDYYEYVFPPPFPHPVDEITLYTIPKADIYAVTFFRNILHTDAAPPSFVNQPSGATWPVGTNIPSLSGTARTYDGGTLSYQWYSNTTASNINGTEIEGETSSYFRPSSDVAGTFYYYVVVTNTNEAVSGNKTASAVSRAATIKVIDPTSVLSHSGDISAKSRSLSISGRTLQLRFSERGKVSVYTLNGAKVRTFDLGGGIHTLRLNNLPTGTYIVKANSGTWSQSARVLLK